MSTDPLSAPLPELRSTLERICETAVESTRARYALIGVVREGHDGGVAGAVLSHQGRGVPQAYDLNRTGDRWPGHDR
ncbi:hypothetical protein [Streptomyces sp. NPDC048256]|uniref:hypothetical protein n=1 Tax=unclassified Streptomyces TaxID=2593676 RepID=UPI0033DE56BE